MHELEETCQLQLRVGLLRTAVPTCSQRWVSASLSVLVEYQGRSRRLEKHGSSWLTILHWLPYRLHPNKIHSKAYAELRAKSVDVLIGAMPPLSSQVKLLFCPVYHLTELRNWTAVTYPTNYYLISPVCKVTTTSCIIGHWSTTPHTQIRHEFSNHSVFHKRKHLQQNC